MYTAYSSTRGGADSSLSISSTDWTLPEPTIDYYTDDIMTEATGFSDVAVICLGRSGGEGADEPTDMYAVIHGTYDIRNEVSVAPDNYNYYNSVYTNNGDYDDFDEGEHYLQLSNTEENMIDLVCSTFDKVIVVVNANNTMELGWVDEYDSIGAVIWAPGTGATGMAALGEILSGAVNPSGKTVDTFVYDLTDTPYYNNIGNFSYTNVDDIKEANAAADAASEGNLAFVNYVEGIYVGYKFYETAATEGFINFDQKVQYPFGYGLSYTTFTQSIQNFKDNGDSVSFDVLVTNTGSVAGKDVVEVYFTPPYTNGGIEKSSVNLVQYEKTQSLEPGASETVSFTINKEDMASYDSSEIKVSGGGYILEAGEYTISIRSDSHTVLDEATFTVASDIDYSKTARTSDGIAAVNQFDYAEGNVTYLSRADGFANYATVTAAPTEDAYVMDDETRAAVEASAFATYDPTLYDDPNDVMPTTGADNGLTLADLTGADYDDERWDDLLDQLSIDDMALMINLGGWQTAKIDSVGKVATNDCDGPAGVNNFITGNYGTSFPSEVLMAQTWSKEMAAKIGDAMGQEYEDLENWGWYGPAMDGHRSAFAGRNFEYYSEDGVLAGYFAAAQVNAAAEHGVYAYIKHFALNDQETNRCAFLLTFSNEQAMREIYVKNYTGTGLAVMSAFNWIGTKPANGSYELLTTVLRDEWGFVGMVETDYDGSYGYMISDHCVRSGNDLLLGFNYQESNIFTDTDSATCVLAMRQACKNILYTVGNSGAYTKAADSSGLEPMTKMFIIIDVIVAVVLIAAEVIMIIGCRKKLRKNSVY
jgi:beta-glucosidase